MTDASLNLDSTLAIIPEVVFKELRGEGVLLNLASGTYFGLDETSTRIWQLIVSHTSLRQVFDEMLAEFEVEPERLERELLDFVGDLIRCNLVRLTPSTTR